MIVTATRHYNLLLTLSMIVRRMLMAAPMLARLLTFILHCAMIGVMP